MTTEQQIQQAIRVRYGRGDTRLWRNNTGVLFDRAGRPVRFGLCNGSSDLIGFRSIVIRPEHVGKRLAVFAALEVKTATGRATEEQKAFLSTVNEMGGLAGVARCEDDAGEILGI
jgi:hypothetical protein